MATRYPAATDTMELLAALIARNPQEAAAEIGALLKGEPAMLALIRQFLVEMAEALPSAQGKLVPRSISDLFGIWPSAEPDTALEDHAAFKHDWQTALDKRWGEE